VDEFIVHMQSAVPEMLYYYEIPGAEVALISGGEVVWSQGFGTAEIETNRPVETDTLFQAASISKTFTAWAVMKLVEEGKMEMDAPIETYLKRWHLPESKFDHDQVTSGACSRTAPV
jgi:CubicO group peptidase (beta-lactamase class C family)